MARLPQPGGDSGNWGDILNEYLSQSLKSDGRLKDNSVTSNVLAPNSITSAAIADDAVNATSIVDGSITEALLAPAVQTKLNDSGDVPTWTSITNKPSVIAAGDTQTAAKSTLGLTKGDVGLGNVDNTSDATKNSAAATLTNKTLVNPKIDTILDSNGHTSIDIINNSGAVNHIYISNQPSGAYPGLGVDGSDSNIGLDLIPKGSGAVRVYAGSGNSPTIQAVGVDSNLDINLITKGTGLVKVNGSAMATTAYVDARATRSVSTLTAAQNLSAAANTDYVVFVGNGGAPTLPTAVGNTSKYTLKNIHTANITVAATLSQTIDGSATAVLAPNVSIDLLSDGANWRIL